MEWDVKHHLSGRDSGLIRKNLAKKYHPPSVSSWLPCSLVHVTVPSGWEGFLLHFLDSESTVRWLSSEAWASGISLSSCPRFYQTRVTRRHLTGANYCFYTDKASQLTSLLTLSIINILTQHSFEKKGSHLGWLEEMDQHWRWRGFRFSEGPASSHALKKKKRVGFLFPLGSRIKAPWSRSIPWWR